MTQYKAAYCFHLFWKWRGLYLSHCWSGSLLYQTIVYIPSVMKKWHQRLRIKTTTFLHVPCPVFCYLVTLQCDRELEEGDGMLDIVFYRTTFQVGLFQGDLQNGVLQSVKALTLKWWFINVSVNTEWTSSAKAKHHILSVVEVVWAQVCQKNVCSPHLKCDICLLSVCKPVPTLHHYEGARIWLPSFSFAVAWISLWEK